MQYLVAVAWLAYIIHGLRRAHARHCVGQQARQFSERLAQITDGMAPVEVRALLGPPLRVIPSPEGITWQYRVDGRFHTVAFIRADAEAPPAAVLDKVAEEELPTSRPQGDRWELAALEGLRRAS